MEKKKQTLTLRGAILQDGLAEELSPDSLPFDARSPSMARRRSI
eukprot:CAMPEP_0195636262 /NCGR_PEP_ID=MMETSP0815-20121206/23761_1 /TAXON_ID=97485 /ORGANISM="Prymnesium parvum, Strain Texoma1" /LENGTH=43 /DNA_ID= /DNA_START= /DNA_END= /DNA_ORIENTATION=